MLDLEKLFSSNKIYYELYKHEPVYTMEMAMEVQKKYRIPGIGTKTLFLKDKQNNYFVYLTLCIKKVDFKSIKEIINKKLMIVSAYELEEVTQQVSGSVSPFGYEKNIPLILDADIFSYKEILLAPSSPEKTMLLRTKEIFNILNLLNIKYYIL